ncbi:unnamed protein product, partial [Schistosoma haematobium]
VPISNAVKDQNFIKPIAWTSRILPHYSVILIQCVLSVRQMTIHWGNSKQIKW